MTDHAVWPILPLQPELAPWVMVFIGLALAVAFLLVLADSVERS